MLSLPCSTRFATVPLLALFAACESGVSDLNYTPPYVTASAEVLDFGEIVIGQSDQRTFFLLNKGELPLQLDLPRYDGLNDVFGAQLDSNTIEPNKDTVLAVRFRPSHARVYTTTITLPNNSSNRPELALVVKGTGINPGPCDGVDCRRAPPPTCITENTTRRYEPMGICMEGRCEHQYNEESCTFGCDDTTGACRADPCVGMSCDTPPNNCYFANGVCELGACNFEVNNAGQCDDGNPCSSADHCAEGTCVGTTKTCTTAPAALCVDASTRRVFNPQGACNPANGACEYMAQDQHCEFGCRPEGCMGDPCAGVVCDMPPNPSCYQPMGTCSMGVCTYVPVNNQCDDGNACTTGDVCNAGTCAGTPMVCNTPPGADCANGTTRRVYSQMGMCMNGQCQYAGNTTSCNDNNACTTGDACLNGACVTGGTLACNDNNACTTDACDPVAGCRYTPTSGNACTTGSRECPTGMCSAGQCLATPNVNCQAEYDTCFGALSIEVPGRCSASGACVVTQPPPQFTCPGCNGLCVQCAFIQLCVPF